MTSCTVCGRSAWWHRYTRAPRYGNHRALGTYWNAWCAVLPDERYGMRYKKAPWFRLPAEEVALVLTAIRAGTVYTETISVDLLSQTCLSSHPLSPMR